MTPEQYIIAQMISLISAQNPGASSDEVSQFATDFAAFYINLILPNLSVNLTTGAITFVVPSGG